MSFITLHYWTSTDKKTTTRVFVLKTCFIESIIRLKEVALISNTTILHKINPKYRAYSSWFEMFISTEDFVPVVCLFAQQLWRWVLKLVHTQCNKAILQEEALLLQGSTRWTLIFGQVMLILKVYSSNPLPETEHIKNFSSGSAGRLHFEHVLKMVVWHNQFEHKT